MSAQPAQMAEQVLRRFNEGALDDSIRMVKEAVKAAPADAMLRVLLAEMHCFEGQFEKADQQLDLAGQMEPALVNSITQFRGVVHGAAAREDFYAKGRLPSFLSEPGEDMKNRLRAAVALQNNQPGEALALLEPVEQSRRPFIGVCDDRPFDDFRDLDDLLSGVLELITADRRYFWVPFDQVIELTFEPVRRPRDVLFRQAKVTFREGVSGTSFVPTTYAGTAAAKDARLRQARATDWTPTQPVRGIGQRIWLAGETEAPIMDVRHLRFES